MINKIHILVSNGAVQKGVCTIRNLYTYKKVYRIYFLKSITGVVKSIGGIVVLSIDIGAFGDEELDNFESISGRSLGGVHDGSVIIAILGVDIGTFSNQFF